MKELDFDNSKIDAFLTAILNDSRMHFKKGEVDHPLWLKWQAANSEVIEAYRLRNHLVKIVEELLPVAEEAASSIEGVDFDLDRATELRAFIDSLK